MVFIFSRALYFKTSPILSNFTDLLTLRLQRQESHKYQPYHLPVSLSCLLPLPLIPSSVLHLAFAAKEASEEGKTSFNAVLISESTSCTHFILSIIENTQVYTAATTNLMSMQPFLRESTREICSC